MNWNFYFTPTLGPAMGSFNDDGKLCMALCFNGDEYGEHYGIGCVQSKMERHVSVELIGLEVNQAIQDWTGTVRLIEGKKPLSGHF